MKATAIAHPNVALVKYWGKQPEANNARRENTPATPSLSIALSALATRTTVAAAERDELRVNGRPATDARIAGLVAEMRRAWDLPPISVNDLQRFPHQRWARLLGIGIPRRWSPPSTAPSRSACRFGNAASGQGALRHRRRVPSSADSRALAPAGDDSEWASSAVLAKEAWPLEVVVAVVSEVCKRALRRTSAWSSRGAARRSTAPGSNPPPTTSKAARQAVVARDFDALATVAEHSCFKMHAVMLATQPALVYWKAATLACIDAVRRLQDTGTSVFCTIDAGPQVKAVCAPGQGGRGGRRFGTGAGRVARDRGAASAARRAALRQAMRILGSRAG